MSSFIHFVASQRVYFHFMYFFVSPNLFPPPHFLIKVGHYWLCAKVYTIQYSALQFNVSSMSPRNLRFFTEQVYRSFRLGLYSLPLLPKRFYWLAVEHSRGTQRSV